MHFLFPGENEQGWPGELKWIAIHPVEGRPVRWKLLCGCTRWVLVAATHKGGFDRSRNQTRRVSADIRSDLWWDLEGWFYFSIYFNFIGLNLSWIGGQVWEKTRCNHRWANDDGIIIYIYIPSFILCRRHPRWISWRDTSEGEVNGFFFNSGELKTDGWWHATKASSS